MERTDVEVRLLGCFDVIVDGVPVGGAWPNRRSAELVQLLAIAPAHRLMRDEIIDALWPRLNADAGGANLRKAAHHARRALGDGRAVVLKQQQVAFFPDAAVRSDHVAFVAACDAALAAGDPAAAALAAELHAGELLPGSRYEEWSQQQRRLVEDRYLAVLRLAGRVDAVVEIEPTDESACRAAMRLALAAGQRHRAIGLYGRLRRVLRDELGVVPTPDTEALYAASREGLAPTRPTTVGRDQELAIFDALLTDHDRDADFVVVRGPAGIGKTHLVTEFQARADESGWSTARVTADDPNDAYATLTNLLDRLVEAHPDVLVRLDQRTRSVLAMLMPVAGEASPREFSLTRHQVVGAVQRVVEAVGGERGAALTIDDVDRCDESSLEVLALLADRRLGRLIVVVTHREPSTNPAVDRAVTRVSRSTTSISIELGPLQMNAAAALVRHVQPQIESIRLSTVVTRSEGVPLFVVELAGSTGTDETEGPFRTAIETRMLELDEHEVAWMRRLAIVGGVLDLDAVLALTGCTDDEMDQLLDRALAAGVLVVDDVGYRFRHELIRDVLARQLPPHQQAAVHRDAARRLTELGARPGRIAGHWLAGKRPAEAADWFARAGDDAIRLGGYAAAVVFMDRALAERPDHALSLRGRATALDALGDSRALAAYEDAIAAADPDEALELRPLQALAQIKMGDPEGALLTVAGAAPRTLESQLAHALTWSGAALLGAAGPEEGTRLSAAGRERSLRSGDRAAVVVASWAQAAAAHARGELRESLHLDLADTSTLPRLAVMVFDGQLCITQRLLYGSRPYDDVIDFTNHFATEARRMGAARGVAFATTLRGEAELLSGRLEAAASDLQQGARLHHDIAAATGESFSYQRLAELAHINGEHVEARQLIEQALEVARRSDVGFHLFDRIYGTKIRLARDASEGLEAVLEAEEAVRGPFETCPGCRITLDVPAAIAAARAGDLDRADRYEQSSTWLADVVMRLPAWYAAIDEVRGHNSIARGDPGRAIEHLTAAADQFAQAGHPIDTNRCATHAQAARAPSRETR